MEAVLFLQATGGFYLRRIFFNLYFKNMQLEATARWN